MNAASLSLWWQGTYLFDLELNALGNPKWVIDATRVGNAGPCPSQSRDRKRLYVKQTAGTTRWSTTLSSKLNLQYSVGFRASCGANLVTPPSNVARNEAFVLIRVVAENPIDITCCGHRHARAV